MSLGHTTSVYRPCYDPPQLSLLTVTQIEAAKVYLGLWAFPNALALDASFRDLDRSACAIADMEEELVLQVQTRSNLQQKIRSPQSSPLLYS